MERIRTDKIMIFFSCCAALWLLLAVLAHTGTPRSLEREARVEISMLSRALADYKSTYGEYPPSMAVDEPKRIERLVLHIRRAFPRHTYEDGLPPNLSLEKLDSAEALVFFLGGIPSTKGPRQCLGLSGDPQDPYNRVVVAKNRLFKGAHFDFENRRLTDHDGDGFWEYAPPRSTVPYVYFDSNSYGQLYRSLQKPSHGTAVAYKKAVRQWHNPESFQIIAAGEDNNYGSQAERIFPGCNGFAEEDYDNVTNILKASFATTILRAQAQLGYGQLSRLIIPLIGLALPPLVWIMWRSRAKFSVKQLLLAVAVVAVMMGALTWDANGLGRSRYLWWIRASCLGSAFALFCLSGIFTALRAAKDFPNTEWSKHVYDMSIWLVPLPLLFVWWRESEALLMSAVFSVEHHIGWPFKIVASGHAGLSFTAILLDAALGVALGVIGRWLIWRTSSPQQKYVISEATPTS